MTRLSTMASISASSSEISRPTNRSRAASAKPRSGVRGPPWDRDPRDRSSLAPRADGGRPRRRVRPDPDRSRLLLQRALRPGRSSAKTNGGRAWNFCEEARCFGADRRRRLDVPRLPIGPYRPGTRHPQTTARMGRSNTPVHRRPENAANRRMRCKEGLRAPPSRGPG